MTDLSRRHFLTSGLAFAGASMLPATADAQQNKFVIPGNPKVGGPLTGLSHNGRPFTDTNREGVFKLVYFGTAHKIGSCAIDIPVLQDTVRLLHNNCGVARGSLQTLFVHPVHDPRMGEAGNLKQLARTPQITTLSGPKDVVFADARKFRANYVTEPDGDITSHTRYSYLMGPDGKNLAIIMSDFSADYNVPEIVKYMRSGVFSSAPTCRL